MKSYLLKAPESDFESWTSQAQASGQSLAAWIRDRLNAVAPRAEKAAEAQAFLDTALEHQPRIREEDPPEPLTPPIGPAVLPHAPAGKTFRPDPKPVKGSKKRGR